MICPAVYRLRTGKPAFRMVVGRIFVGAYMNHPTKEIKRNRYRINGKKLWGALLVLGFISACIVIIAASLNRAEAAVGTERWTSPSAIITIVQSSAAQSAEAQTGASASQPHTTNPAEALKGRLIVVDAGHGGFDPGASGVSGVREDELNLQVAMKLKAELEARGAEVIMTREDENALAATKEEDMAKRRRIIEESGSDIVISVHMNSFPQDPGVSGPLVLFAPGSEQGKKLAGWIQDYLNEALEDDGSARSHDNLIILESGTQPCVIVECGYLSNEEEEEALRQEDYQQRVTEAICDGAAAFFCGQ
jgi:N-acetylmuramoyl-L-alanine amidase